MHEEWKQVCGYEGFYEVSSLGRVRSLDRVVTNGKGKHVRPGVEIKPATTPDGYLRLALSVNGKARSLLVHRLVAIAFIDNKENKPETNHKNGVKTDNRASNLEWVTGSENCQHSYSVLGRTPSLLGCYGTKHHLSKRVTIDGKEYGSYREAARILGCTRSKIKRLAGLPYYKKRLHSVAT